MKKLIHSFVLTLVLPTLAFAQEASLDGSFSNPSNFTDQEMESAKTFEHQGIKDRKMKEGCAQLNNCSADEDGLPLEMIIGKAYTLIGMISGGGMMPTLTKATPAASKGAEKVVEKGAEKAAEKGAKKAAEKDTQPDYCMMVAMAYETFGGMLQQNLQSKAEKSSANIKDPQLQSLVNLKETHKARAKTASWQRNIYGGVTLCYAGLLATGQVVADWSYAAKVAGSTALTMLYQRKVSKHDKAAKTVQTVIDSLPKSGDCNPWTGTACFCSEPTSKDRYPAEYQEVCVVNGGNFDTPKIALGCGAVQDNKLTYDKECKCKQTNTCMKSNLKAYYPKFALGSNLMDQANKNFELLNSGEFDQGKLDIASTNATALASKIRPKYKGKIPKTNLTAEQQKIADELKSVMPEPMANVAAASSSSYSGGIKDSSTSPAAVSKLSPKLKEQLATAISGHYKKGGGGSSYSKSDEPEFVMPSFGGPKKEESGGTEVVSFAEQAVSKADVSNTPTTPIFEIISNRYKRSAWQKLEKTEE